MLVVQSGGQQWGSGLEATRCQGSRVAPAADEPIEDKLHIRWTHWGRATLYQAYHLLSTVRQSSKSIRYGLREGCVYVYDMTVVTAMLSDEVNWVRGTLYQVYHLPSALYCQMNCHWSALLLCDTMSTSRGTVAVISFTKVATFYLNSKKWGLNEGRSRFSQGCINCSSLPAGLGARGVSSEHVENMENAEKMKNMEMFSGSPT